jgi:putative heme transporter
MGWPSRRALFRFWRPFRVVAGFVLLGVAIWVIAGKSSELAGTGAFLNQIRWAWLAPAAVAELVSYLTMAALQRILLVAGQTRARLPRVALVTFSGSAIQAALPVGAAFAGLYEFRQYQMIGADEVLAGWVVIASAVTSFVTLAAMAGVGLALAASTGSTFDLVGAILGVLCLTGLALIAWARRAALFRWTTKAVVTAERRMQRPAGHWSEPFGKVLERMRSIAPSRPQWALAMMWATASWLADCACLACAYIAVSTAVPWQGLLLAYCAGQLAVNLPITPGGLGVVEGSLTMALVAFGGGEAATVAAVLLYRILSFWLPLPIGAGCWVALARIRARLLHHQELTAELSEPSETNPAALAVAKIGLRPDGPRPKQPSKTKATQQERGK